MGGSMSQRMVWYKVVNKVKGNPNFYKINREKEGQLIIKFIKCPGCNNVECVDINQMLITCKGCGKKFRIYKKNILEIKCI